MVDRTASPLDVMNEFLRRSPASARPRPSSQGLGPSPLLLGAFAMGQVGQAYAAYQSARLAVYAQHAEASALRHRARMLDLDRRAAEMQADAILQAGQDQQANLALEGGQQRAELIAANNARGIDSSVGSAREVLASERLMQAIDAYNINLSTVRQANAARRGAVAIGNEAALTEVSARNVRRAARAAAPEAILGSGLGGVALNTYMLSQYRQR
jgi:hypothetical protein